MKKRIISLATTFVVIMSMLQGIQVYAGTSAEFTIIREITPDGEVFAGNDITIKYTVTPTAIEAEALKPKEIVIIFDESGSMSTGLDGSTRSAVAKAAATKFMTSLKAETNAQVDIAFVEYNASARILGSSDYFYDLATEQSTLEGLMSQIGTGGMTNIGDAMRRAYHLLNDRGTDADKYIICLTDGLPNTYSYNVVDDVSDADNDSDVLEDIWVYQMDSSNQDHQSSSNYTFGGVTLSGTNYIQTWVEEVKNSAIKPFYIGFTGGSSTGLITAVSNVYGSSAVNQSSSDKKYYQALDTNGLDTVYTDISRIISNDYAITDMKFVETFPKGLVIDTLPFNVALEYNELAQSGVSVVDGKSTVNFDIPQVTYTYNASNNNYTAPPFSFEIKMKATDAGAYKLSESESDGYISFTDPVTDATDTTPLQPFDFMVHKLNPPIINMLQDPVTIEQNFSLSPMGSGNIFFDGNDRVRIEGGWQDDLFGKDQYEWSVRTMLYPTEYKPNSTVNGVYNPFLVKDKEDLTSTMELGFNDAGNLMVYLISDKNVDEAITIGNGELTLKKPHEIFVSFDSGILTAVIDGITYVDHTWVSATGDTGLKDNIGSNLYIGGSRNSSKYFEGRLNLLEIYDSAVAIEDIYQGISAAPIAKYIPDVYEIFLNDTTVDDDSDGADNTFKLLDASGNGHDTEKSGSIYVQGSASTAGMTSGEVRLQYSFDEVTWTDYTLGSVENLLNAPGSKTVYARAIHNNGSVSDVVQKTGEVKRISYIDDVFISALPTEIQFSGSSVLTYEVTGPIVEIPGYTDAEIILDSGFGVVVYIPEAIKVDTSPSNLTQEVATPTYYSVDVGTVKMIKNVDGHYQLEPVTFEIEVAPNDVLLNGYEDNNLSISTNSVAITYEDVYDIEEVYTGGNGLSVIVKPTTPTIKAVTGDDLVNLTEEAVVYIEGKADPGAPVVVKVKDRKSGAVIELHATADASGNFVTDTSADLSGFDHDHQKNPFDVEATVTETGAEGNVSAPGTRESEIIKLIELPNGIL